MTNIVDDSGNAFSVDKSSTQSNKPRIRRFSFGDGYEQRIADGINTLGQMFDVRFVNRTEAEMNNLIDFFETKNSVTPFAYSPPNFASVSTGTSFTANSTITGTGFTGLGDEGWVIIEGSASNDKGYSIDSTGTNNATTLTVFEPNVSTATESFTVYKAIGVICEEWSVVVPQVDVVSVTAKFKRVYEP
jgi:phage-related protein